MLALAPPLQHPASVDYRTPSSSSSSSSSSSRSSIRHPACRRPSSTSSVSSSSLPTSSASIIHPVLSSNSRSSSRDNSRLHSSPLPPPQQPSKLLDLKPPPVHEPVDIHAFPANDLLRLLASLLTQIAAANDSLSHPPRADSLPFDHSQCPLWKTLMTASKSAMGNSSSSLSFHARNIPTISLESYLLRILKYCPTTNEVFLSLLVYFDRMAKLANQINGRQFVIDSYNIHRLIIAGVTVASKFFSDVFYTNSRYAKVGGLPQSELNQLELQFLLLNDFRLTISPDEMQRYAEQLIVFSEARSPSGLSIPQIKAPNGLTSPMQAMGAVDAYGGTLSSSPSAGYLKNGFRTPKLHPRQTSSASFATTAGSETDASDAETSEADGETDDEPTIRPAHSSCSSDTLSMYSAASEDTDGGGDDEEEDVTNAVGDHQMGSP